MTAARLRVWVNNVLLPMVIQYHPQIKNTISTRIATRWLHSLGFHPSLSHKGVYLNGHERADVAYHILYLSKLEILESNHAPLSPCSDDPVRV